MLLFHSLSFRPENVLLTSAREALLADFSLSFAPKEGAGTPAYLAPELRSGAGGTVSAKSDIYSLGMMVYCMLSRRVVEPPSNGAGAATRRSIWPPELPAGTHPSYHAVLQRMLAIDPTQRPTCSELLGDSAMSLLKQLATEAEAELRGAAQLAMQEWASAVEISRRALTAAEEAQARADEGTKAVARAIEERDEAVRALSTLSATTTQTTRDKELLQGRLDAANESMIAAMKARDTAIMERDVAKAEAEKAAASAEKFAMEVRNVVSEMTGTLARERDGAARDREIAARDREIAARDRERDRQVAASDRRALEAAIAAKQAAFLQSLLAQRERDTAQRERDTAQHERDNARRELDELRNAGCALQ